MTIDELARDAGTALRTAAEREVDPALMFEGLRRLRARRRIERVAALAVVAVLAVALAVSAPWSRRALAPAHTTTTQTSAAEVLVVQNLTELVAVGGDVPHLPAMKSSQGGFVSLAFSPDGSRLAYSNTDSDGAVDVMDVATGTHREVARCTPGCPVAWTPDGRSLITVAGSGLSRIDASSGSTRPVRTPAGWKITALDVNARGRLVLAGTVGAQAGLMAMDLDGGNPALVRLFGANAWVTEPRWSPDGRTIAYLHRPAALGTADASALLSLRTVSADGSQARTVVGLGICGCGGGWPGLDWSPSGQIAVIGMPPDASIMVYLATLDGTLTPTSAGNGALAWRPGR